MNKPILFICTGNYYRSRFAEALFNHLAEENGLQQRAASRGLAVEGNSHNIGLLSFYVRDELARLGIPLAGNLRPPLQLSEQSLQNAARIIALDEAEHRPLIARLFPGWEDRVEYWQVSDIQWTGAKQALGIIYEQTKALVQSLLENQPTGEA